MENKIPTPQTSPQKPPNDTGSIAVDGFVKIFDPKTRKVFVEQKA